MHLHTTYITSGVTSPPCPPGRHRVPGVPRPAAHRSGTGSGVHLLPEVAHAPAGSRAAAAEAAAGGALVTAAPVGDPRLTIVTDDSRRDQGR